MFPSAPTEGDYPLGITVDAVWRFLKGGRKSWSFRNDVLVSFWVFLYPTYSTPDTAESWVLKYQQALDNLKDSLYSKAGSQYIA